MRSPFPGMDPYLERTWGDVHLKLCAYVSETLQSQLPSDLRARAGREVLLEDSVREQHATFVPDTTVHATKRPRSPAATSRSGGGTLSTIEPVFLRYVNDPPVQRWVHVIDAKNGGRVVTAIEILSPGNKRSSDLNDAYRRKIDGYIEGGVNVVEIDLLRGRRHKLRVQHADLPPERPADYLYCVRRADADGSWEVYPIGVRDRLPTVPVPLRETDADVSLDLQALIDHVYVAGGYDDIDYTKPADPPLSPDDADWLRSLLANRPA